MHHGESSVSIPARRARVRLWKIAAQTSYLRLTLISIYLRSRILLRVMLISLLKLPDVFEAALTVPHDVDSHR